MLPGEYARSGLLRGLQLEAKLGVNPFKFGLEGATDTHTGLSTIDEDNFFGKFTTYEPSPERAAHAGKPSPAGITMPGGGDYSAAGLTAVWATENTRGAIFDAMERREVYATTGPRMRVRFFGGWGFEPDDALRRDLALLGYTKGVPMGADLPAPSEGAKAPTFLVYALRDPIGANLDRIQIIKGWLDADGNPQEKVYDVAWSGDRQPGAKASCPPWATPLISRSRAGPTPSAPPSSAPSGATRLRPAAAGLLLRPGDRDPHPALDRLRPGEVQAGPAPGDPAQDPGAGLHLADLVHAQG